MYELDTNVNVSTLHDHLLSLSDPFTKKSSRDREHWSTKTFTGP